MLDVFTHLTIIFKMMKKQSVRTLLSLLQIGIGVAVITIVLTFLSNVISGVETLEKSNVYEARYEFFCGSPNNVTNYKVEVFTEEMVDQMLKGSENIEAVMIVQESGAGVFEIDRAWYSYDKIYGVDNGIEYLLNLRLVDGRFFQQLDISNKQDVIIISELANRLLFGEELGVGKFIYRKDEEKVLQKLEVIGVFSVEDQPHLVEKGFHLFMPYTAIGIEKTKFNHLWAKFALKKDIQGKREVSDMVVIMATPNDFPTLGHPKPEFVQFREIFGEDLKITKEVTVKFGIFIGSFALVAIIISFVGVLSMMMVSIVERTKEIGLRRALGASRLIIVKQVLSESVILSMSGSLLGIVLAMWSVRFVVDKFILQLFQQFTVVSTEVSLQVVLVAIGGSILIGLLSGLYPAVQAAGMAPVEALAE